MSDCVKLIALMLCVFGKHAACQDSSFLQSLQPGKFDCASLLEYSGKYSDGFSFQKEVHVRVRWDGETLYAVEQLSHKKSREDALFRDGGVVRVVSKLSSGEVTKQSLDFFCSEKSGQEKVTVPGRVFSFGNSFGVIGCIDGYRFRDYFPEGGVKSISIPGKDELHFTSDTAYGNAIAKVRPGESLPYLIEITKSAEHLTNGRIVGEIQFDSKDTGSFLTKLDFRLEVKATALSDGKPHVQDCMLSVVKFSGRGEEANLSFHWLVDSFDFDPVFPGDRIDVDRDIVEIEDGQSIQLVGSPLPFVWSERERWVVPEVGELASLTTRGSLLLVLPVGTLFFLIAIWISKRVKAKS